MNKIRLTASNVASYLNYTIEFNSPTYGGKFKRTILGVSESGESIKVDFPQLNNCLNVSGRKLMVLIPN